MEKLKKKQYFLLICSILISVCVQATPPQVESKEDIQSQIQFHYNKIGEEGLSNDSAIFYVLKGVGLAERSSMHVELVQGLLKLMSLYKVSYPVDSVRVVMFKLQNVLSKPDIQELSPEVYSEVGDFYRFLESWDNAIAAYQRAMEVYILLEDSTSRAVCHNDLGNIYLDKDEFYKALQQYQEGSKLHVQGSLQQATVLRNIGLVHFRLKAFEKSSEYYEKALKIAETYDDIELNARLHQSMGMIERALGNFDVVLSHYEKALAGFQKINASKEVSQLLSNIGNLYFSKEELITALKYYEKALEMQLKLDYKGGQCYTLAAMGSAYMELGKMDLAETYLLRTVSLGKKMNQSLIVMDGLNYLSALYAETEDFSKAYQYHVQFKSLSDSIYFAQNAQQIVEMEVQYESDRKGKEITLLNAENEIKQLQITKSANFRNYLIAISLIVLGLAFVLYYAYITKSRANKKLEELDQDKTRFFTNISHEFRTPLTLIIGPLERLLKHTKASDDLLLLQVMHKNANRLLELANQLLDLSKLDAGNLKLSPKPGDVIRDTLSMCHSFTSLAEQRSIHFAIEIIPSELLMSFDRDKYQKILTNLLANAFKFTQEGGQVTVEAFLEDNHFVIKIKDTGCGIPENKLEIVFDRFQQADESHQREGTGIGLSLTKELVALHDGTINVESAIGEGTEFCVRLPINIAPLTDVEKSAIQEIVHTLPLTVDPIYHEKNEDDRDMPLLLVVDDNLDIRKYVRSIFENNYTILEGENGQIGYELALEQIPDLIISDLMMPEVDGIELCARLRKNEAVCHIPIVLLTAKADSPSKLEGLESGADDYLLKPFKEEELRVRVVNLIEQRRKLRMRYAKMIFLEPGAISIVSGDENFVCKAQQIVEENINNHDFTVEQFQKQIGMSRMQLHRKLKALINCSASEFIRDQRLQRAAQFLNTGELNVSEAAYQSGFNNLSYFAKCFKVKFGISPSDFKQDTILK